MRRIFHMSNRVDIPQPGKPTAGGLDEVIAEPLIGHKAVRFGWSGNENNLLKDNATYEDVLASVVTTVRGNTTYLTYDLPRQDFNRFYAGTANGFLWMGQHRRTELAAEAFSRENNVAYERVNRMVARVAKEFIEPTDILKIHDFHNYFVGEEFNRLGVQNPKGFFLHIPPFDAAAVENFESREQQLFIKRLTEKLFEYDFVGLQSLRSLRDLRTLISETEPKKLELFETETFRDKANAHGVHTRFGAFPVGVDINKYFQMAKAWENHPQTQDFIQKHTVGYVDKMSVDRMDPAKGIVAKAFGVGKYLREFGSDGEYLNILQIAPYGRRSTPAYRDEFNCVSTAFKSLNEIFYPNAATLHIAPVERPIHLGLARQANEILVTSLADGFNIYILEGLAANLQREKPAVGILSKFTGAAEVLNGAVLRVDPSDPNSVAGAINRAHGMGLAERQHLSGLFADIMVKFSNQNWQGAIVNATIEASKPRLSLSR